MITPPDEDKLHHHFQVIKQIIADQDMLERVPAEYLGIFASASGGSG